MNVDLDLRRAVIDRYGVDTAVIQRLDRLVELLLQWQKTTQLVSPSTLPHTWVRHIEDSLQLLRFVGEADRIVDLGSGGGFPGLIYAICLKGHTQVHLVESLQRKAAFLRTVARELGLNVVVHCQRIEAFNQQNTLEFDIISARALASLSQLCEWAYPLMGEGRARCLFPKGENAEQELIAAQGSWDIGAILHASTTDSDARIVEIRHLKPKP